MLNRQRSDGRLIKRATVGTVVPCDSESMTQAENASGSLIESGTLSTLTPARSSVRTMLSIGLSGDTPSAETVHHLDTCLSWLGCMTTCPSNVNYQHLIDHARAEIEIRVKRPLKERLLRVVLSLILPHPGRFRLAARLGRIVLPVRFLLPHRLRHMIRLLDSMHGKRKPHSIQSLPETRTRTIASISFALKPVHFFRGA